MNTDKKAARELGSDGAAYQENFTVNDTPEARPIPKWQRILSSFLTGRSWHALAAVRDLHTTCLHTDIAGLEARGLRFHRERVIVAGYGGEKTSVVRYSLLPESFAHARTLLGRATPPGPSDGDAEREYRRASGG